MKITIGKVSKILGVNVDTVRRWEKEGKIKSERTNGGHRRYDESEILLFQKTNKTLVLEEKKAALYIRANNQVNKSELEEIKKKAKQFCKSNQWNFITIEDISSSVDYSRKGLIELIGLIEADCLHTIVVPRKEYLDFFGKDIFEEICKWHQVNVISLPEEENIEEDILRTISDLTAKLIGKDNPQYQNIINLYRKSLEQK